jgi:hypothetical protein
MLDIIPDRPAKILLEINTFVRVIEPDGELIHAGKL